MPMKTKFIVPFALVCLLFTLPDKLSAQEVDSTLYKVEMQDGNVFIGTIISRTTQALELETETLGVLTIPIREIADITAIDAETMIDGELWEPTQMGARYFYAPNGYGLRKGEGYYQNILVLFNQVSYGISDHFTLGVGTVPLFLFQGAPTPLWITPKVSLPIVENKFQLGAGALVGAIIVDGELETLGIMYATATVGPRDRNLSLGLGWGFFNGEIANSPTTNLSGQIRVSKRTFLVSENYIFFTGSEPFGIMALGGRTVWDKVSLDYGLAFPIVEGSGFIGIPWLGVGLPFGKAQP